MSESESSSPPVAPEDPTKPTGGRRRTAWMAHVKATMRANKGLKLKQVLKLAKKTYKKTAKRGGGVLAPMPLGGQSGARRRGTRKSRRGGNIKLY